MTFKLASLLRHYKLVNFNENDAIRSMQSEIAALENGSINFKVEGYPDGTWYAESTNVEGLNTGGFNQADIKDMLKDAIFTYYNVPPQFCDDRSLRNTNEPVTVEQQVRVSA